MLPHRSPQHSMTTNPWQSLDITHDSRYVLPDDWPFVEAFNAALKRDTAASEQHPPLHIFEELVPEPWLGRRDAPVCLLLLNPGMAEEDFALHRDPAFRAALARSIVDDAAPHFHLASPPSWPARRWWSAALASVRRAVEVDDASALRNAVSAIQLFPYHSREFGHLGVRVPSQAASIARVHEHLERRTLLVVRSWLSWVGMVPELADPERADHVIPLRGRGVRLHPNTVGGDAAFRRIVEAIRPSIETA